MNNADMPAMPSGIKQDYNNIGQEPESPGLTKREHFASMAMQGLLSGPHAEADCGIEGLAHDAVLAADALLAELSKRGRS